MLVLYLETWLNSFIKSNSFVGFLHIRSWHLQTYNFTFSFPIWMSLISFSYLIPLARTSSTIVSRSDESGHPCFVLDHRGHVFSFSSLSMMLAVNFSCMSCWQFFLWWVLTFAKCFLWVYWYDHMIFILHSLNVTYCIICFAYVEPSFSPSDKSHFIMMCDPFNVLLYLIC